MEKQLGDLVSDFPAHPQEAASLIRRLMHDGPGRFCTAASALLRDDKEYTRGHCYVITLLSTHNLLLQLLCMPSLSLKEAIRVAQTALEFDPLVDTRLAEHLAHSSPGEVEALSEDDEK